MKKVFSKENVKKFWKENKEFVIGVGVAIGGIAATMVYISNANKGDKNNNFEHAEETFEEFDYGRNCLMTFTVEETGEKLGTVRCTETYVQDWVDSGLLADIMEHDYNIEQDETEQ